MRFAWMMLALIGCGDETKDPEESGTDDTGVEIVDTAVVTGVQLQGVVTLESGAAAADAALRLCRGELCRTGATDSAGAFNFNNVPLEAHSFEVVAASGSGLSTAFSALQLDAEGTRTVNAVLPEIDVTQTLGAEVAELEMGGGLFLTAGLATVAPPSPLSPDATEITSSTVAPEARVPVDGASVVHAMWYVGPFDYHSEAGLPMRVEGLDVADGTYRVWVGSYAESKWLDAGELVIAGGAGSGPSIGLLSTVVIVTPN